MPRVHDSVLRILDANANRAREALRVHEEAARFVLVDGTLCSGLKQLRHELAQACARFGSLERHRDTAGDPGSVVTVESERRRSGVRAVVEASAARLGEALRSLEEYGKVASPDAASTIESIRYRAYDLSSTLLGRLTRLEPRGWMVCVLLTESLCRGRPWHLVLRAALDGGADAIQLREKQLGDRELLDRALHVRAETRGRAAFIMNDRPDIALLADADGIHVGQDDLPVEAVRRAAGWNRVIGVSTAGLEQAVAARSAGADYVGVGPMFRSSTKQRDVIAGPEAARRCVEWDGLPHLAIGGVTLERIPVLRAAGVRAVAVSAAVLQAEDPAAAVAALRAALRDGIPVGAPGRGT
ncbi:MAG: thiamine phosphate synthase [Phycisphaeraceae bacterium]|nr:thiamine phosphate synthase [Phycisphaeraceae bacterium]